MRILYLLITFCLLAVQAIGFFIAGMEAQHGDGQDLIMGIVGPSAIVAMGAVLCVQRAVHGSWRWGKPRKES
jgi:hypothetical protein